MFICLVFDCKVKASWVYMQENSRKILQIARFFLRFPFKTLFLYIHSPLIVFYFPLCCGRQQNYYKADFTEQNDCVLSHLQNERLCQKNTRHCLFCYVFCRLIFADPCAPIGHETRRWHRAVPFSSVLLKAVAARPASKLTAAPTSRIDERAPLWQELR